MKGEIKTVKSFVVGERIYVNAERTQVVDAESAEAASLYAIPGDEIPYDAAVRLGLITAGT